MAYVTQVFGCPRREPNCPSEKRAWGLPEIKYSTATVSTAFITHLRAGSQEHFTAPVCAVCKAPVIVNGPIKLTLMSTFVDTKLRSRGN